MHAPQEMLYRIASVGMSWIVHNMLLPASVAQRPVQCQVAKSGVFDASQPGLR